MYNRGAENSIRQQFELEITTAINFAHIKPQESDFVKGVYHKLIDKIKEPAYPEWNLNKQPSGISSEFVQKMLSNSTHSKLNEPLLQEFFGINYKSYPFHMGLPNGKQVKNYITGNDGSGLVYHTCQLQLK